MVTHPTATCLPIDFISLNDIEDPETRLDITRQKLMLLPPAHLTLLSAMMPVFVAIAENHAENSMTGKDYHLAAL